LKLTSKAQWAAMAAGDFRTISRAAVGSMLLGGGWRIRKNYGGEKWYELRVGERLIDTRPFNPLSPYLFMGDVVERLRTNQPINYDRNEVLSAILGANIAAGTGLYLVDQGWEALRDLAKSEKRWNRVQEFAGQYAAGFLTPLRQIGDIMAQFDEQMRIVRDVRQEPFLGPIKANIPGLAETLPEAEIPTRAGPLTRPAPGVKQVTGVRIIAPKNPAEAELDRLGFKRSDILPGTGDRKADRAIAKYMGPLVEQFLVPLIQSERYQNGDDDAREGFLRASLSLVRQVARAQAAREEPELFRALRIEGLPKWQQRQLRKQQPSERESGQNWLDAFR